MTSWQLHIEKPSILSRIVYLFIFNVFWSLSLCLLSYFNISFSHPHFVFLATTVVWITVSHFFGIESYTEFPGNLVFHIIGSCISAFFVLFVIHYLATYH